MVADRPRIPQRFSFAEHLKEIDRFFEGRSEVHHSMRRLVNTLGKAGIAYAIYGGMAVNAHGHRQTTDDVDVLLTDEGLAEFRNRFTNRYEATRFRQGRRFLDRANGVCLDVVVSGHFPGVRSPGGIPYPNPDQVACTIDGIHYVSLVWLIRLKLATRRYHDLGDVAALIRVHGLDESYLENLSPLVHQDYIKCLEEVRREKEYEARDG